MTSMELVGLNTKWYRYQNNLTQEQYANKTKFKMVQFENEHDDFSKIEIKTINVFEFDTEKTRQ